MRNYVTEIFHTISIQFTFSNLAFKQVKKMATAILAETYGNLHHFTRPNRGTQSNQQINKPTNQSTNQKTNPISKNK
jgi:hypothetical protein